MYSAIQQYCASHQVDLIVVSKLRSLDEVKVIYEQGQRKFAENRVQDLLKKQTVLPDDIDWHLIGTLQSNKVKNIAPFVQLIHSVDSIRLWIEIDRQATAHNRVIPCLLQIKIASEETKNGFKWTELYNLLKENDWKALTSAPVCGVMGMASFTDDQHLVRHEFAMLKSYFDLLKRETFEENPAFNIISMGMSGDYKIAIEEGATMVRIGSLIFEN